MRLLFRSKGQKQGKAKIAANLVTGLLALVVAGLLFLHFSPNYGFYYVKTGSMAPYINSGDIIITGPVNGWITGNLEAGKVITYEQNKAIVSHRIVSVEGDRIYTKGDANEDADAHPITADMVDGIFMFRIPLLGYINSSISTRSGWFIAIIVPTILLVLFIIKDVLKETFRNPGKETAKS